MYKDLIIGGVKNFSKISHYYLILFAKLDIITMYINHLKQLI